MGWLCGRHGSAYKLMVAVDNQIERLHSSKCSIEIQRRQAATLSYTLMPVAMLNMSCDADLWCDLQKCGHIPFCNCSLSFLYLSLSVSSAPQIRLFELFLMTYARRCMPFGMSSSGAITKDSLTYGQGKAGLGPLQCEIRPAQQTSDS